MQHVTEQNKVGVLSVNDGYKGHINLRWLHDDMVVMN